MYTDRKSQVTAGIGTALLHATVLAAVIWQSVTGGATTGKVGADHGDLVEVSLNWHESRAASSGEETAHFQSEPPLKNPPLSKPGKITKSEEQLGSGTEGANRDVTRAVTLKPSTTETMTDAAVLAYRDHLADYLKKFRRYPDEARRDRVEGTVVLHFVLDGAGDIVDAWIVESSGSQILDAEALSAIRRAQPLPAAPLGWPQPLDVTLPMSFQLS